MNSPVRRSLEIDFLRGLVLIAIALDHVQGSVLSRFMLHNYAYCDAAEVFVFLGGYASAAAYTNVATYRSVHAARRRFFVRALEIYRAYLFTAALMLTACALLTLWHIDSPVLRETGWVDLVRHPVGALLGTSACVISRSSRPCCPCTRSSRYAFRCRCRWPIAVRRSRCVGAWRSGWRARGLHEGCRALIRVVGRSIRSPGN